MTDPLTSKNRPTLYGPDASFKDEEWELIDPDGYYYRRGEADALFADLEARLAAVTQERDEAQVRVGARLVALLDGLGVPVAAPWLNAPPESLRALGAAVADQASQLAACKADADRLDWFDKHADGVNVSGYGHDDSWTELIYMDGNRAEGSTLRSAIDAALAARTAQEEPK
jgi:hypothetical protein